MRRILMTADTVGGVWTFAVELARALAPCGARFAIAAMGGLPAPDQRAQLDLPNVELFESAWKLEWMEHPWEDVRRAGEWLLDIERRFEPDVIHLNQFCFGALPFRAPVLVTGHSCVLSWWRAVRGGEAPSEWDRYREAVAAGLRGARAVIAPSAAMLSALREFYGPLGRAAVIPNGRAPRAGAAKEPFVFSAGRIWDEAKNIAALDRAAEELAWPVYVAGEGGRPNGRATFLGRLGAEETGAWMDRAAIYALPALYEPFGLSVLEAASAGCALVLGDIPSLRENWEGCAAFVDPRDSAALARGIRRLIERPSERAALAARSREKSLAFTPARMAAAYLSAYQSL